MNEQEDRCNIKQNRFYQDLTCYKPDPLISDTYDMWDYKNSHRGALDMIPVNDQEDSAADNWYGQNRNYDLDVDLSDPELNDSAKAEVENSFIDFIKPVIQVREESEEDELEDEYNTAQEVNENISQFEMFADSLYLSVVESMEARPLDWRSTKRIATRMTEESFGQIVDRKIKDETLAESFKAMHRAMIGE